MAPNLKMIVDTVDDENHRIGTSVRKKVLADKKNFRTVHILLFKDGKLLMQKLPNNHMRSPGKLGSSVAGYLKTGETYEKAAYRKMADELSLQIPIQFCCQFSMKDENSTKFVDVYRGEFSRIEKYDAQEIEELFLVDFKKLRNDVRINPSLFTATFLEVFKNYEKTIS